MKPLQPMAIAVTLAVTCACLSSKSNVPAQDASGSTSAASSAATARITDPCKLLTEAEASEAIGAKLGPGVLKNLGVVTRCAYSNRAQEQELWLDVQNSTAVVSDPVLFDSLGHGPDSKWINGIGDQAVWAHSQYATFLYVLKGGNMVAMGLPRTMATVTPAVEKAAKLVATRM